MDKNIVAGDDHILHAFQKLAVLLRDQLVQLDLKFLHGEFVIAFTFDTVTQHCLAPAKLEEMA